MARSLHLSDVLRYNQEIIERALSEIVSTASRLKDLLQSRDNRKASGGRSDTYLSQSATIKR